MPVSLSDVAARAGVSSYTVSSVINNKTAARISAETQRRVRLVAEEMGYRPNSFARSMARQRTNTLRLITSSHENPFFVHVAKAVDWHTRKAGYKLWVDATMDERWTYAPGEEVGIWPVDGALIYAHETQDMVKYLGSQATEIPVVYLGYEGSDSVDAVTSDLYAGAKLVTEHVVERGYRKIAFLAPENARSTADSDTRMTACHDVCRKVGMTPEVIFFDQPPFNYNCMQSLEAGVEIAARPADQRPDAIICFNDSIAVGLLHGIRRAGLQVPDDIAITGFDGSIMSMCLDRPLTTVAIPIEAMCKAGIELLVRRIGGDTTPPAPPLVIPAELVIGRTT